MFPFDITISSVTEMEHFSFQIGSYLLEHFHDSLILLEGELGTGKTAFTRGLGKALEIEDNINSPTFNLLNVYEGKSGKLFHYDLYRIQSFDEVIELGFTETWDEKSGIPAVHAIEWWKKAGDLIPDHVPAYIIEITYLPDNEDSRRLQGKKREK